MGTCTFTSYDSVVINKQPSKVQPDFLHSAEDWKWTQSPRLTGKMRYHYHIYIIIIYVLMIRKFPYAIKAWVCKVQGKRLPHVLRRSHRRNSPDWTIHTQEAVEDQPECLHHSKLLQKLFLCHQTHQIQSHDLIVVVFFFCSIFYWTERALKIVTICCNSRHWEGSSSFGPWSTEEKHH